MYNLDDYVIWTTFEGVNVHDPQSFSHGSLFLRNKKKRKDRNQNSAVNFFFFS